MAITLGSIVVDLIANTGGFTAGLTKASQEARRQTKEIQSSFQDMGDKIGSSLSSAFSSLGEFGSVISELSKTVSESLEGIGESSNGVAAAVTALGALGGAAIAAAAGMAVLAKEGAEVTEHLSQVSQKTGISISQLQVLEAAGASVGLSLDDMVAGFRKFDQAITGNGKNAGAAQQVLKNLGITARDNREALLQAADAFKGMEDGPQKAADAVALFGKQGLNLIPFLNKGRDGILEFQDAVSTFGPVITNEGIKNTEDWKVSVEKLSLAWQNLEVTISDHVLPALTKATTGIAGLVRGASVLTGAAMESAKAFLSGENVSGALAGYLALRTAETAGNAESEQALQRKNEAIEAYKEHYKEIFELEKSGGEAALALSQAQEKITAAIQQEDFKTAARLEATLPSLQAAADTEAKRLATAKQLAATYAAIEAGFAKGSPRPLQTFKTPKPNTSLWNTGEANPLEGAPDLGSKQFADLSHAFDGLVKDTTAGKQALEDFYSKWNASSRGTADSIINDYAQQLSSFMALLDRQQISEQQYDEVRKKLETNLQLALKQLRQDNGASTWGDAWQDMFARLEASGKDFARSFTEDIGNAIQDLNQQMAKLVATGQGLNLKQIGQNLLGNITESVLKKGESSLFSSLGGLFGLGNKPDGSTAQNALWVQFAGSSLAGAGAGIGSLPLGSWNPVNLAGPSSNAVSALSDIGSGIGNAFKSVGSLFGGFLAGGGDTQPGKAYIVGEKRPELFVPGQAGRVIPAVPTIGGGPTQHITVQQNISTPDADSFRRSGTQIASGMTSALSRGASRLGR